MLAASTRNELPTFLTLEQLDVLLEACDDEELVDRIRSELKAILAVTREPVSRKIYRWQTALPQYRLGHHGRSEQLNRQLKSVPGLHLVGNFLDGVGISDCIRHARSVSEAVKEA